MSPAERTAGKVAHPGGDPLSLALPHQGGRDANRVAAIILAAGSSTRMGFDKMWAPLDGLPVVGWSIRAAAASRLVDDLIVAIPDDTERRMAALLRDLGVEATIVRGGAQRQDSVRSGIDACPEADWVVIHDGARPFLTAELIEQGLEAACETGAAIAAVPVVDTIKTVAESCIVATPPRDTLWAAQTPQVFRRALLLAAHERASSTASDDAALVEALGERVRVYLGAYGNIKITTPVDLRIAAALLASDDPGQGDDGTLG
jgi:2-C-methyl-D-erythritol 4-phosphate cytidylyltransferase